MKKKYQYTPLSNPPSIIQTFRENDTESEAESMSMYWEALDKIRDSKLGLSKRMMYAQASLPLVGILIKTTVEERGKFDIVSIPAIEIAIRYSKENNLRGQLLNLRDIVNYFPELKPWRQRVEKAIHKVEQNLYGK